MSMNIPDDVVLFLRGIEQRKAAADAAEETRKDAQTLDDVEAEKQHTIETHKKMAGGMQSGDFYSVPKHDYSFWDAASNTKQNRAAETHKKMAGGKQSGNFYSLSEEDHVFWDAASNTPKDDTSEGVDGSFVRTDEGNSLEFDS